MLTNGPNIYQAARKESCLTQEQAAERMEVSETTVKAWEQGARVPDNETVARMAELYGTPWLKLKRLLQVFEELEIYQDDGVTKTLPTAVLSQWDLTNDLIDGYRRLIQITADGHIDETEEDDFEIICNIILQNCVAGLKVVFGPEEQLSIKKERPEAATSKRSGSANFSASDCENIISHPRRIARASFRRRVGASL